VRLFAVDIDYDALTKNDTSAKDRDTIISAMLHRPMDEWGISPSLAQIKLGEEVRIKLVSLLLEHSETSMTPRSALSFSVWSRHVGAQASSYRGLATDDGITSLMRQRATDQPSFPSVRILLASALASVAQRNLVVEALMDEFGPDASASFADPSEPQPLAADVPTRALFAAFHAVSSDHGPYAQQFITCAQKGLLDEKGKRPTSAIPLLTDGAINRISAASLAWRVSDDPIKTLKEISPRGDAIAHRWNRLSPWPVYRESFSRAWNYSGEPPEFYATRAGQISYDLILVQRWPRWGRATGILEQLMRKPEPAMVRVLAESLAAMGDGLSLYQRANGVSEWLASDSFSKLDLGKRAVILYRLSGDPRQAMDVIATEGQKIDGRMPLSLLPVVIAIDSKSKLAQRYIDERSSELQDAIVPWIIRAKNEEANLEFPLNAYRALAEHPEAPAIIEALSDLGDLAARHLDKLRDPLIPCQALGGKAIRNLVSLLGAIDRIEFEHRTQKKSP